MDSTKFRMGGLEDCQPGGKMDEGSKHQQTSESATLRAINNPLILDIILTFVLYKSKEVPERLNGSHVAAIRLVSKNWLQSASSVMKKSMQPAMAIVLGEYRNASIVNQKLFQKSGSEILDDFVSTFGSISRLEDSNLTLNLVLRNKFFTTEDFKGLKKTFDRCAKNLLALSIDLLGDNDLMSLTFETFDFPNLHEVHFELGGITGARQDAIKVLHSDWSGISFLRLVLNGTRNLKTFHYVINQDCSSKIAEKIIHSIILPKTVTRLTSSGSDFTVDYRLLMKNMLPNLKELRLEILNIPCKEHIFEILDRFKTTLKLLHIKKGNNFKNMDIKTFLRFPLMEKLESFLICGSNYQLDPDMKETLSKRFPNLTKLTILRQTECDWMKWIENSKFENVCELGVLLCNEGNSFPDVQYYKSPSIGFMQQLQTLLPNVHSLQLNMTFEDLAVLSVLFRDWKQLRELRLTFNGKFNELRFQNLLASAFLGVSYRKVHELRKMLSSLDKTKKGFTDLELELEAEVSLVNLTELTSLTLEMNAETGLPLKGLQTFTDLLPIAFNKMPNLRKTEFLQYS